jgi:ketol-acid reductoisomerase
VGVLDGRTVVIGYGNQDSAQVQKLWESRGDVLVDNRGDSYAPCARDAGFRVLPIADAARVGAVALLLIPDEDQPAVFAEIAERLSAGDTLVVASGYNVTFGLLEMPDGVDVVMVAPQARG